MTRTEEMDAIVYEGLDQLFNRRAPSRRYVAMERLDAQLSGGDDDTGHPDMPPGDEQYYAR